MSRQPEVADLDVRVDRREVLRWLGYRCGRGPGPRVARRLDELWPEAADLVAARGGYRVVDGERAGKSGMPRPTPRVGVAVATIGDALEREARRRGEHGRVLDALLLDAIGSAAAEAAADALNHQLCATARAQGHYPAARVSPGYGRWQVEGQKALLELLPADRIGVRLTPGLMLVPHKSVSFAVRFASRPASEDKRRRRCRRCGMSDCPYREDEANGDRS